MNLTLYEKVITCSPVLSRQPRVLGYLISLKQLTFIYLIAPSSIAQIWRRINWLALLSWFMVFTFVLSTVHYFGPVNGRWVFLMLGVSACFLSVFLSQPLAPNIRHCALEDPTINELIVITIIIVIISHY